MGVIQPIVDLSGKMDQNQLNTENINNIINEFNRNADQLDSLSQGLKIISKGSGTIVWNGTFTVVLSFSSPVTTTTNYIFSSFFSRSDQPNNLYSIPHIELDGSFNTIFSIDSQVVGGTFKTTFISFEASSPITFTIYYFIIQQPTTT